MKFERLYSLAEIAKLLRAPFEGNEAVEISGINEIHRVEVGDIVFVDHPKYYDKALNSKASVVLINKKVSVPKGKGIIVCDDPFNAFNKLLNYFYPFEFIGEAVDTKKQIGENTRIHTSVVIGNNVTIGNNCLIMPNVTIMDNVSIGNGVIIQAGSVIGSWGFYYKNRVNKYDRLLSVGKVIIGDNVEIGANCSIDKGVTAPTTIGEGSKIDNLVQIGHDSQIGKKTLIASQSGIAGCVTIGDEVTIWGQVGISSGITIGNKVTIHAQSGVSKSLESGLTYFGSPAEESRKKLKEMALVRRLPELLEKK